MIRLEIKINGIVQGVGFRPFIHKLVKQYELSGWVRNTSSGVVMEVEGDRDKVRSFVADIKPKSPVLSVIEQIETYELPEVVGYKGFVIIKSEDLQHDRSFTLVSPDVCICEDCRTELLDHKDRRYRYPFINCTNCGPRFTIIKDIPYDREKTTMAKFQMCNNCIDEYSNIENRRYHAQPDCCEVCGPKLFYIDSMNTMSEGDPLTQAIVQISNGSIVAVKGIGGIHLVCRADSKEIVQRLRMRKHRDEKPFAIMCRDVETARNWCDIGEDEQRLLESHRRPIVLLRKKDDRLAHISNDNCYIGVMLPYTPVHLLLLEKGLDTVVMTSANHSDMPILYQNDEALSTLSGIADGYLLNDRDIHVRCDDSLMYVFEGREYPLRRSRGYAPLPIKTRMPMHSILACGAEQKAGFALSKQEYVFNSQHIGDMKNMETYENYIQQIEHYRHLFDIEPQIIACDLHPDYLSTEFAKETAQLHGLELHQIQHHHAHMASCMADNMLNNEQCAGIIWDGTGYGEDGEIWGGEFLLGSYSKFHRFGSVRPIKLPGGDRAVKEISRIADAMLFDLFSHIPNELEIGNDCERLQMMLQKGLNCPASSSVGRLFDGISALAGIRTTASYEGQGAIALEGMAENYKEESVLESYSVVFYEENHVRYFDWRPMVMEILKDKQENKQKGLIASRFMNTLVDMAVDQIKDIPVRNVILSGGVFQNMYLLRRMKDRLTREGYIVYTHHRVSTNDEGIALGQLFITQYGGSKNVSCNTIKNC